MTFFLTVDGVDGTGKTTLAKRLSRDLGATYFKSPSSPFDESRAIVDVDIDPLVRYFFYRAAIQHDSRQIKEILANGVSVVCDRYAHSTYAYHHVMDSRVDCIHDDSTIIKPDIAILLTASRSVRAKRISERGNYRTDTALEQNMTLQDRVQEVFQSLNVETFDSTKMSVEELSLSIQKRFFPEQDIGGNRL